MRLDHITPKQLYVVCYVASYRCNINFITVFKFEKPGSETYFLKDPPMFWSGVRKYVSDPGFSTGLLGNNSVLDPPDPIPNSEVKRNCADDSVGSPHVKVGHCQALNTKASVMRLGLFLFWSKAMTCFHNRIRSGKSQSSILRSLFILIFNYNELVIISRISCWSW